jgi:hypothetical protein
VLRILVVNVNWKFQPFNRFFIMFLRMQLNLSFAQKQESIIKQKKYDEDLCVYVDVFTSKIVGDNCQIKGLCRFTNVVDSFACKIISKLLLWTLPDLQNYMWLKLLETKNLLIKVYCFCSPNIEWKKDRRQCELFIVGRKSSWIWNLFQFFTELRKRNYDKK